MRHSTHRIRSTHGGNLPRPAAFDALLRQGPVVTAEVAAELPGAVRYVVDRQLECGVDVLNDGEYVKAAGGGSYSGYIHQRVSGWEVLPVDPARPRKREGVGERERRMFPGFYESGLWLQGSGGPVRPGYFTPGRPPERTTERVATGPVTYTGHDAVKADTDALTKALSGKPAETEGFVAALGPLSLGAGARNEYYSSEEEYMTAVAEVVREEYKAITDAGFIVQVDEPEFATSWQFYPDWDLPRYRRYLEFCVEIINHALDGLPEDQVRFHVCWGSGHRPHVTDIDLVHIADLLLKINAQAYSVEAGNGRDAHEWTVCRDSKLPDGKIVVAGVISHAPDLVAAISTTRCN
jgi:5-methyltetrahydropteroyltriglutamate--homocysteine methyltransferase